MRGPGRLTETLPGLKAVLHRHGRSLALLTAATTLAAIHVPLWGYERGLLGPTNPDLRLLLSWPLRFVALLRELARIATIVAARLLMIDVREWWLDLLGRVLVDGDRSAG